VLLLLFSGAAVADDDWPMFRGGPSLTGAVPGTLPQALKPAWTFEAEEGFESSAAIYDGAAYVGSLDGNLYAVDLATGKLRWKYAAGEEIKSSPTVVAGMLYFGDESGTFHAVDASSGKRRWTFETGAGIISSANVAGSRLVFGSYDNSLYGLNAADGNLAWKVETEGYVHATPAVFDLDGETVAASAGCDGYLRLVRLEDGSEIRKIELGGYVAASSAVLGDRAYLGTFENRVVGVGLREGKVLWSYEDPDRKFPYYASPAVHDGVVVIGGRDKQVHAVDAMTGASRWKVAVDSRVDASPVIVGERALIATTAGALLALDLDDGAETFRFESGSGFLASPSFAAGTVIIGDLDGVLYAFRAAKGGSPR
jgi:outer membrane protein assembly factor BamB